MKDTSGNLKLPSRYVYKVLQFDKERDAWVYWCGYQKQDDAERGAKAVADGGSLSLVVRCLSTYKPPSEPKTVKTAW